MKRSIKAKIKRILNKNVLSGKQAGRALLLNLVYLTQYGDTSLTEEEYIYLIDHLQTPTDQKIYSDYVYINHSLIDARNTIFSYFEITKRNGEAMVGLLREMGAREAAMKRIESIPLLVTSAKYEELKEKALKRRGAIKLSFSQVLYIALCHYLPDSEEGLKKIREGSYKAAPPAFADSLYRCFQEKIDEKEAEALLPVLKASLGLMRQKLGAVLPSDAESEEEARTNSALISIMEGIYNKTEKASIPEVIEITDQELRKTREKSDNKTKETIEIKSVKIQPIKPDLQGRSKSEFLQKPVGEIDLSKAFFSFPNDLAKQGEEFEDKEICLEAFKDIYADLYKALKAEVERILPTLKGADKKPFDPVISLKDLQENSPFSVSEYFEISEIDRIQELPSGEREQAKERGLAVIVHSTISIINKNAMAFIESGQLLAPDYLGKSRRKVVEKIKEDADYSNKIKEDYIDILERMKFLTAYSLLIKEFGKAQRVPELESFDFDARTIQHKILDEGNALLRQELCHIFFDYGRNTAELMGSTFRLIEPDDYKLQEEEKARIIELARNTKAMAEGSILSSLLRALHGNKKR